MVEILIRGGVFSAFSKPLTTMNNEYLERCCNKLTINDLLVEDYNLYAGIKQNFLLPLKNFEILDVNLSSLLETRNAPQINYVFEVDFEYPDRLHNMHHEFPLAPRRKKSIATCLNIKRACWSSQAKDALFRQNLHKPWRKINAPFVLHSKTLIYQ